MATGFATGQTARWRWPLLRSFAGYKAAWLAPDLVAGLTLAAIAIPEQMATARLGGLAPQIGFFAFIAGTLAFVVFGSSRQLSSGADSTIAPIFAGSLALMAAAGSPHYGALAAGLALMVGALVAIAGVLRMGWIGNLLSIPVTTGFLLGIAIHIIVSQLPAALGLAAMSGSTLHRLTELVPMAAHANLAAVATAAGVLALIALCHAVSPRLPGPLLAVAVASAAVAILHLEQRGIVLLGAVKGGLPRLSLPALQAGDYIHLAPLAVVIALVVMVQTAATARSFPPAGQAPDVDGDFRGLGVGGLISGLVGAFPVNASPPRTAIVAGGGGRSQLAGLAAVAVMVGLLAAGSGLLRLIPQAALSGILLFVALRIIRLGQMAAIVRASPVEAALVFATAAAIILLPIQTGVAIGILLSLLQGLWSSARMKIEPLHQIPGASVWWPSPGEAAPAIPGVAVLGFQAPLTFLNADAFVHQFLAVIATSRGEVKLAILEATGIIDIDFTAAQAFKDLVGACKAAGVTFAVARLESIAAQRAFKTLGLRDLVGADHLFDTVANAIAALGPRAAADLPTAGQPG